MPGISTCARPASISRNGTESSAIPGPADEPHLTPRETDVLRLSAKGTTLAEVSEALGLSRHTVSGYLKDVYRKLSIGSRAEATLEATDAGW